MNLVQDAITLHLPSKQKTTPSGWTSFNAPCCHHNGTSADTRQRGGIIKGSDGEISYHCFNCGFKTGWQPGRNISYKLRQLLQWLNVPDDVINKLALEVMKLNEGIDVKEFTYNIPEFETTQLPEGAEPLSNHQWAEVGTIPESIVRCFQYMLERNLRIEDIDYHWSPTLAYRDRLIIPFRHKGQIVGWTGRAVKEDKKPKYLSEQQPGYCFNLDNQTEQKVFAIVCEGVIDAIHVDGISLLGSELSEQQALLINQLNKQVIVVPDRDKAGKKLVSAAIEQGWSVSMPNWDEDINDIADAVNRYGRVYTLYSIVTQAESYAVKIKLKEKKWFG